MAVIRAILTTIQFRADQLGTPLHISFGGADTGLSSATVLLAGEKKNDEIRRGNNEGRLKKKKKKKLVDTNGTGGVQFLNLAPPLAVGLILVSCCPGGQVGFAFQPLGTPSLSFWQCFRPQAKTALLRLSVACALVPSCFLVYRRFSSVHALFRAPARVRVYVYVCASARASVCRALTTDVASVRSEAGA